MNHDTILWLAGLVSEAIVVALCLRRRMFSETPFFCTYIVWSLLVDLVFYYLRQALTVEKFFLAYIPEMLIDAVFQFAVLVELGWAVLKPIRSSLPKHSAIVLSGLILLSGALIWPIAAWTLPRDLGPIGHFYIHLTQTLAALRVVIFVALAGFSQMLSIGWRNRELQIATGLGIYSIFRLAVSLIHTHAAFDLRYEVLEQIVTASYDFSLVYWIVSFAQPEKARQEFSPKMESFLLSVAGAARTSRIAVANSTAGGSSKNSRQ